MTETPRRIVVEFQLDEPRSIMYDELDREIGSTSVHDLLSENLRANVHATITQIYDNRSEIADAVEELGNE